MGLIRVQCDNCKKGMMVWDERFKSASHSKHHSDNEEMIYCSRKKCRKARNWISKDGTQQVKQW